MTRKRKALISAAVVLVLLAGAVVAVGAWYGPMLRTETGYAAHNACAMHYVVGRDDPDTDLPPNPLVPVLRTEIHAEEGRVRSSVLGVAFGQTAWASEHGCAVGASRAAGTRHTSLVESSEAAAAEGPTGIALPRADLDPASTGLRPEWTDERADISLDHLLRMTSGLEWDEEYDLGTPVTRMLFDEPDMAAFAAAQPLVHAPGEFRQYSSGTTNIVCDLLHERTGLDAEIAEHLLFGPLGMDSAVLEADASGRSVCSSYLWATPRDFARLGQFVLDDGVVNGERLLPEGWMDYATTVVPAGGEPEPYGAQWWLNEPGDGSGTRMPDLPAGAYWASGHDRQYIVVVPSADLVVVRTGFSPGASMSGLGVDRVVGALAQAVGQQ